MLFFWVGLGSGNAMRYTCGDFVKHWSFLPINGVEITSAKNCSTVQVYVGMSCLFCLHSSEKFCMINSLILSSQLCKSKKLLDFAEKCLKEGTEYYYGIEACNEVLDGGYRIDSQLKHDFLCTRAALLLKV